jgi:Uma2 family endonuclease
MTAQRTAGAIVRGAELPPNPDSGHLMGMPLAVPRYTAEEVRHFPDDRLRYEVIRGELFVTPAPGTRHQRAVLELARQLQDYLKRYAIGETLPAPFEVEFTDDTAVQPDVLVILAPYQGRLTAARLYGPPALAIEVVSYSSKRTDRLQKRDLYQQEGVPEYWVVDTDARHVERWRPSGASVEIVTQTLVWQPVASVPPLSINLEQLFRVVWERLGDDPA